MSDKQTALERESLVIRGVRSELVLDGGTIRITKEATTQARPTEVVIGVGAVRGTTVESPRRGARGWFHVASTDGSPAPVSELAATGDPYTLPINARQLGACRKLARMIDKHVRARGLPTQSGPNQGQFSSGVVLAGPGTAATPSRSAIDEAASAQAPPKKALARKAPAKKAPAKKAVKKATGRKPANKSARKKSTTTEARKKAPAAGASTPSGDRARAEAASELVTHLRELGELHAAGVLDDEEFAAAKARILAG